MVRTRQTVTYKLSIGKSPKIAACKAAAAADRSSSSGSKSPSTSSKNRYSGGNPVHPREIPVWQRSITSFFPTQNGERPQPSAEDNEVDDDVDELRT